MHMLTVVSYISNTRPKMLNLLRREHIIPTSKVLLAAWFMDLMEFHRLLCLQFHNIFIIHVKIIQDKNQVFLNLLLQKKKSRSQLLPSTVKFQYQCTSKWLLEDKIYQIWLRKAKRSSWPKTVMIWKKTSSNVQEPWWKWTLNRTCTRKITFHIIQPETKIERGRNWTHKCSWVKQDSKRKLVNSFQTSNLSLMERTWTHQEDRSILLRKLSSRSQVIRWRIYRAKLTKRKEIVKTQIKCNIWCKNTWKTQPGARRLANELAWPVVWLSPKYINGAGIRRTKKLRRQIRLNKRIVRW